MIIETPMGNFAVRAEGIEILATVKIDISANEITVETTDARQPWDQPRVERDHGLNLLAGTRTAADRP